MGSSPSKQKKLTSTQNGNDKVEAEVTVDSSKPVRGSTVITHAVETNGKKSDDFNKHTTTGASNVKHVTEKNIKESGTDQRSLSEVSKCLNNVPDAPEERTTFVGDERTTNIESNDAEETVRIEPNVESLVISDVEDSMDDQIQNNYKRRIPTIKWKDLVPNCYKMDHSRRGKAIVINNENFLDMQKRKGTFVDYTRIVNRLRKLMFDVTGYIDVTCDEIMTAFRGMANEDHSDADCFACVILSHGESDCINGIDGALKLDSIFKLFQAENCPTLAGKPKLFFIQACRGTEFDDGCDVNVNVADAQGSFSFPEEELEYRVPEEADFLISYSTTEGYYSWRNSLKGSWYIQSLVHVLDQFGTVLEIQKLLTRVNKMVSQNFQSTDPKHKNKTQMPSFTSKLTKDLYFVPKTN
ncbi:Caspase-6 [Mactra antiquata]